MIVLLVSSKNNNLETERFSNSFYIGVLNYNESFLTQKYL